MAKKKKISETPTQAEKSVGEILSKTDMFVEKYLKQILIVLGVVVLVVIGIIAFHHSYLKPRANEANIALFEGENYFGQQQWDIALKGDSADYVGFAGIIDDYSGTPAANLAKAYAGICEYNLRNYEDALKYFESYKGKDQLFAAQVMAMIGDCYVNLGHTKKGIEYFHKAAAKANHSMISPIFLNKAAVVYENQNDYKSALDIYNTIKTKYPASKEASGVDKYIERAKAHINP
ncbi:MAG: tetratricopeptide repeat protein [Candidatus Azobacteroides sp.]|nr:tetratricopeptide repeat protein [Candidatus Azobacteroides sp.]